MRTLLPVLLLLHVASGAAISSNASTAHVSTGGTSLLSALEDPRVASIIITGPTYSLGTEFEGQPLQIDRNVSITGSAGTDTVLDLNFARAGIELCSTCGISFSSITVANERRGTGNGVDFVVGRDGSAVLFEDAQRLRLACTAAKDAAASLKDMARSQRLPGKGTPEKYGFSDVTFQGHSFPNSLLLRDVTTDEARTNQEGWGLAGGYAVGHTNVVRLCRQTVDEGCLAEKSPESCVNDHISQVKSKEEAAATATAAGSGGGSQPSTGLVAGVAVAGAALLLSAIVLTVLLVRRRRRKRQADGKASSDERQVQGRTLSITGHKDHGGDDDADMLDVEALRMFDSFIEGCNFVRAPLGMRKGWEVSMTLTTPMMGPGSEKSIQLGDFLGAGSFGRVYKASYLGKEVAVKVIEHNSNASTAVENEVSLMLSFNHPNVVRAFYCVTYTQACNSSNSGNGGNGSTAGSHHQAISKPGGPSDGGPASSSGSSLNKTPPMGLGSSDSASAHNALSRLRSITATKLPGVAAASMIATPESCKQERVIDRCPSSTPADAGPTRSSGSISIHFSPLSPPGPTPSFTSRQHSMSAGGLPRDQLHMCSAGSSYAGGVAGGRGLAAGGFIASNMAVRGSKESSLGSLASGSSGDGVNRIYKWMGNHSGPGMLPPAGPPPAGAAGSKKDVKADRAETWLVQEFCDCGTLGSIVSEWNMADETDERMLKRLLLLQDAARGLKVLHGMNVVHGDLTARNVLVSSSSSVPYGLVAKLADLGLSRVIKLHKTHRTTNTVGTMSHMPPELLRYGHMSTAVDIYAFGVMMWELYTNQAAFNKLHYGQFFETVVLRNLRPMVPAGMPADYQLLMEHCWASDYAARPNVDRLLECLRFMIQERENHLDAKSNAGTRTQSAPLPVLALQRLPRTGFPSDSGAPSHLSLRLGPSPGAYGGSSSAFRPMHGFPGLPEGAGSYGPEGGDADTEKPDMAMMMMPAGIGRPGSGPGMGLGLSQAQLAAAGFGGGGGSGSGLRHSLGDRSSIGIQTPIPSTRPPLPLQQYRSGDYSQELPREESWFV